MYSTMYSMSLHLGNARPMVLGRECIVLCMYNVVVVLASEVDCSCLLKCDRILMAW
jgi:hypothetical protein